MLKRIKFFITNIIEKEEPKEATFVYWAFLWNFETEQKMNKYSENLKN